MMSMNAGVSYEARVLHAAADGIGPALLLSAPKGAAQYLVNVPEGFARLALEHKLRPSARLSCVLLSSLLPQSAGGLGGLVLRLAQDGHGQVQMIGPQGAAKFIHSFRHIFRWRHPKVLVSECGATGNVPVFEDEYVVLLPIVAGDLSLSCPWCRYGSTATAKGNTIPGRNTHTTKSSSSDTDSTDAGPSSQSDASYNGPSTLSEDTSMCRESDAASHQSYNVGEQNCVGSSCSNDDDEGGHCKESRSTVNVCEKNSRKRRKKEITATVSIPLYSVLDDIFSGGKNKALGMKNVALSHLKKATGNESQQNPTAVQHKAIISASKLSAAVTTDYISSVTKDSCDEELELGCSNGGLYAVDAPVASPISGMTSQTLQPTSSCDWLINNDTVNDLPDTADDANPVYVRDTCGRLEPVDNPVLQNQLENGTKSFHTAILGFVCFLKKLGTGVILVNCKSAELESFWLHPVLRCVRGHARGANCQYIGKDVPFKICPANNDISRHSVAAVIHLSPYSLENLVHRSEGSERKVSGPPHIVVQTEKDEFGFCSSLETLAKLNTINCTMFPLPFDAAYKKVGVNHDSSTQVVDGQDYVWEVSMLTRVVFEIGPKGVCTVLNRSECVEPIDTCEVQKELLQSKPQLLGLLGKQERVGIVKRPPQLCRTANQLAAVGLKEKLKQRRNGAASSNCHSSSEHLQATLKSKISQRTMTISNFPLGVGCSSRSIGEGSETRKGSQMEQSNMIQTLAKDLIPSIFDNRVSEFELIFLGTGSAEPSKFRGSSGILLQTGGKHSILLDAGEGCLGQLVRRFGKTGASEILMSLECVWLSHKHADHVLGIMSLIEAQPTGAPLLTIIGPSAVKRWIYEVVNVRSATSYHLPTFQFMLCDTLSRGFSSQPEGHRGVDPGEGHLWRILEQLELQSLKSVIVDHCHEAYGLVLHGKSGWSVVYSGDTRPCHRLVQAGVGCTLLIHEATFEENLSDHARRKRHSTVPEALEISTKMAAQYVILTHFSQRYPQVVTLNAARHKNVGLAFDGMVVCSSTLEYLGQTLPFLALAFSHSERPELQPVQPSSYENGSFCLPITGNLNTKNIGKLVEVPKPRVIKMKGFTSSFDPKPDTNSGSIQDKPIHSKFRGIKPITSKHIRFSTLDSESGSSDDNDESSHQHIRLQGNDNNDAG